MTSATIVVALASATCYALSSALQQRAAKQERPYRTLDPRLLLRLLRRPLWLAGWLPDLSAIALQALALHLGPIALVQPVLVSGMFLAIPMEAALDRRRPYRRDLLAVALSAAGLGGFLATAQPRAGLVDASARGWLGVALGSAVVLAICLVLAALTASAVRGTLLGIAAGLLFALTAVLLKPTIGALTTSPLDLFTNWHVYALIPVGLAGLLLNQNAFQHGPLAAPLTALTLTDPIASVAIAVTAFHEELSTEQPRVLVEAATALVMAIGIWLAATTGQHGTGRRR